MLQAQLSDEQSSSVLLPERARREAKLFEANVQREIDAERRACREQEERLLREVEERCLSVRRSSRDKAAQSPRPLGTAHSTPAQVGRANVPTSSPELAQARLELARAKKLREEAEERVAGESAGATQPHSNAKHPSADG
jgi:hypothetical protein